MAEGGKSSILCRYYLSNCCNLGASCRFSHDRTTGTVDNVCRYYQKGACRYGDRCRYDHVKRAPKPPPPVETAAKMSQLAKRLGVAKDSLPSSPASSSSSGSPRQSALPLGATASCSARLNPCAVDFTPGPSSLSYAAKARSSTSMENATEAEMERLRRTPLCSYYEQSGECPLPNCQAIHGDICELCSQPSLHPFNEEQRKAHIDKCISQHEENMQLSFALKRSMGKLCAICMDTVLEKEQSSERRFGILEKCTHVFCLTCIRQWRGTRNLDQKTVRACPVCRVCSDFVTPSAFWVDAGEEKTKLIQDYKSVLGSKPCKYFKRGQGDCPFRESCFYLHANPDGTPATCAPRRRTNHMGQISLAEQVYLADFLSIMEDAGIDFDGDDYYSDLGSDSDYDFLDAAFF